MTNTNMRSVYGKIKRIIKISKCKYVKICKMKIRVCIYNINVNIRYK